MMANPSVALSMQPRSLRAVVAEMWSQLRRAPLLAGWLIGGPLVAGLLHGPGAGLVGALNILLCGIYALIIRWMTPDVPPGLQVRRPWRELGVWLALLLVFIIIQTSEHGLVDIPVVSQGWRRFINTIIVGVIQTEQAGVPHQIALDLANAASSTIKDTIPIIVITLALGYGWRGLGLAPRAGRLTLILLAITILLGLPFGLLTAAPPWQVAASFAIGIFINALPEELIYRSFLIPRLEAVIHGPLTALVVSTWLFNVSHVPIEIAFGADPWIALADSLALASPNGLIWGYLFLRTRSILPGVLWHAANINLGLVFFSPNS